MSTKKIARANRKQQDSRLGDPSYVSPEERRKLLEARDRLGIRPLPGRVTESARRLHELVGQARQTQGAIEPVPGLSVYLRQPIAFEDLKSIDSNIRAVYGHLADVWDALEHAVLEADAICTAWASSDAHRGGRDFPSLRNHPLDEEPREESMSAELRNTLGRGRRAIFEANAALRWAEKLTKNVERSIGNAIGRTPGAPVSAIAVIDLYECEAEPKFLAEEEKAMCEIATRLRETECAQVAS